jgi:choline dehydrogenase-like flavoprotein
MSGGIIQMADLRGGADVRDEADVVIIGSGVSGATAARVLAEAGLDVIVLEEGPHVKVEERRADVWSSFKRAWRDAGFQVAEGRTFMPVLQGRCVGGSSPVYGAIVHRIPEAIHAQWMAEKRLDPMFSYETLQTTYDQLDAELHVAPAPEDVLGRNNQLMRAGCEAMGIKHNAIRRNVVACEGSARCLQGCPNGRKQSMDTTFLPRAIAKGARVYATCRAERVVVEGGRAVGVKGRFHDDTLGRGPAFEVRARKAVIMAASAIQTPLILAASGIGKASGVLGHRLQMHPGTSVMGVFDEPVNIWFGATQGYETTNWWNERMKFESVGIPFEVGVARLPGYGASLVDRIRGYGHVSQWGVQVRAKTQGRVFRGLSGRTVIRWSMSPEDVRVLKLGVKRLAQMNFAAGAKKVYPGVHGMPDEVDSVAAFDVLDTLPDDPRLFHCIASHMMGTAVMGPDAATNVVRPDGRTHDVDGLWVADSSIFPTNLGVNPAHTIAAMSWCIAQRVAGG